MSKTGLNDIRKSSGLSGITPKTPKGNHLSGRSGTLGMNKVSDGLAIQSAIELSDLRNKALSVADCVDSVFALENEDLMEDLELLLQDVTKAWTRLKESKDSEET